MVIISWLIIIIIGVPVLLFCYYLIKLTIQMVFLVWRRLFGFADKNIDQTYSSWINEYRERNNI